MSFLLKIISGVVVAAVLAVGGYEAHIQTTQQAAQSYGAFTPVGGQTYTLSGAGINSTATSIQLNSFTTPDGRPLTMSMFGAIGYAVVDPNSPTKIEDITFTGITQNANGSAVLTGVSRGIDFVSPYAASTTLSYSHSGGSYLILSNTASFYGQQFLFANQIATSSAVLVFSSTTPPHYDFNPTFGGLASTTIASKGYVDSVAISGAPNSSETVNGISQLATAAQAAAGTSLGSTAARLVLPSSLANATPSATIISPITSAAGKLAQGFLDLTQAFSVSGVWTFANTLLVSAGNNLGIGTSTPYAALSVVSSKPSVFGTIYATSTASGNATSTFDGNIQVGNNATTTNLFVGGFASIGLISTTSAAATGPTSNTNITTQTAFCPTGYSVIGGGVQLTGVATIFMTSDYPPNTTSWQGSVICTNGGGCGANTITVTALCARVK